MHVPEQFAADARQAAGLVRANPFALLMTNGDRLPLATDLAAVLCATHDATDDLLVPGRVLHGHMNRQNPHWRAIAGGCPALLAFSGPDAYIDPNAYGTTPAAPTWDFTVVQVEGDLMPYEGMEETLSVLRQTVTHLDALVDGGWDMTSSLGYHRQIAPGVGAFRLVVTGVAAMFKVSQEQSPDVRDRVVRSLQERGHSRLAALVADPEAPMSSPG